MLPDEGAASGRIALDSATGVALAGCAARCRRAWWPPIERALLTVPFERATFREP